MKYILFMDSWRWFVRLPAKVLLAAVAVTLVTFPYPQLLLRHIEHWRNPNALIDAESPALEPLLASLEPEVTALGDDHEQILKTVESRVYKAVPYAWDWDTWGTADYMPTVEETLRLGKEDCDGRAVVAASVLRHFGYETELVTDFAHVWVKTDKGETMGPGGRKVVEGGKKGVAFNLAGLVELPNALAFGVAVFPLERELILLVVFWWLCLRRRGGATVMWCSLLFLLNGLIFLRAGGANFRNPERALQWLGILNLLVSVMFLWFIQIRQVNRASPDNSMSRA